MAKATRSPEQAKDFFEQKGGRGKNILPMPKDPLG
jgi:hypothetical protein